MHINIESALHKPNTSSYERTCNDANIAITASLTEAEVTNLWGIAETLPEP